MAKRAGKTWQGVALTHRGIETLQPEASAYRVPDLRCPGLGVRVATSGQKTWDLVFRIRRAGGVRRLSLGRFPGVGLEAARERANALTGAAQAGRDLLAEEKIAGAKAQARVTVGDLIERYLHRMVRGKLRTAVEIELRLQRTLAPVADHFADVVRRRDLREILEKAVDRGVMREAEKQRQLMRSFFRWALSQDAVEIDPSAGLASYGASPRRDRVLSSSEIKILWDWIETCGMPLDYVDALKLQLATGARIGEASGIRAEEVDRDNWIWALPAERSKNSRQRLTPLIGIARQIVEGRLKKTGRGPLFVTEQGNVLTSNCVSSLLVKRRKSIPLGHFTSHDLRRTVATGLVDLAFPFEVVAAVLGHEAGSKDVRTLVRHYVRTDLIGQKQAALEAWDNRLKQIIAGDLPHNNVTNLVPRRDCIDILKTA